MADFRVPLITGEYYHVFNRGVARNPIFLNTKDYSQALLTLQYYCSQTPPMKLSRFKQLTSHERESILLGFESSEKKVEVVSFVLMPNHFHFLLKQTNNNGITKFIAQFSNSYTKYFNKKYDRVGALLQGVFKAVHLETEEQLLHLSRYIHINPLISFIIQDSELFSYSWSSLPAYLSKKPSFIYKEPILNRFSSIDGYKQFLLDQIDYGREIDKVKHLTLES